MWKKRRHKIVITILRPFFKLYFKIKYKCSFDKKIKIDGGSIILSNHVTTLDPFMIGCLFSDHVYYMASLDLFEHKFVGKLIKWLVNPIPKEKSKSSDLNAIKICIKVAKENGNICIFPEGNRTLSGKLGNIDYSIVKLVKKLKKPLILCNIEGGYGTDPRWCNKVRKGKMHVGIKHIYQYDEIKDMDNDELYSLIINTLNVDDVNYHNSYKSNAKAESLERVFYICPVCKKMHSITTSKNIIKCSNCGLEVEYLENLTFKANKAEFKFNIINDWYEYQIDVIKNINYETLDAIYEDKIEVWEPRLFNSKLKIGTGVIKIYSDKFIFELESGTIKLNFDEIEGVTLLGKKKMNIYCNNKTYQIFRKKVINLLKYMHLFYLLKNRRQGVDNEFLGL